MHKLSFTIILLLIAFYVQAQSPHGKSFKTDCVQCHTSTNWSVDRTSMIFNHDNTNFKLIGQHKSVNCKECHTTLDFKNKRVSCTECHTDMHNSTLGNDCSRCHTPNSWIIKNTSEMHQQSRFPLLGAHKTASCSSCHKSSSSLQFEPLGIECNDCHQQDFRNTTSPNHVLGGYSTNCLECHSSGSTSWNTKTIDHSFFPLTSGHAIGCTQCHVSGKFAKLPTVCNSCHQKNYTAAVVPNHVAAGIPNDCATCHTTTSWKPSPFNHTTTGFELKGGHKTLVQCSDCHKGNLTAAKPECITCHQVQYDTAPKHKQLVYPNDCSKCHTFNNWLATSFNHTNTNFPLTGTHQTVDCAKCHISRLAGTPTQCNSCHQKNYTATQTPVHITAGITTDCATCHNTIGWKPASFNHITTGFELKGRHKSLVQCSDCHKGNLTAAKPECISCHQLQYDNAPKHKQSGYSTNCIECHGSGAVSWSAGAINHDFFPLTAGHAIGCVQCHITGTFGKLPTQCSNCHQKNYTATQVPNHITAGISNDCATCHTPTAWKPSSFNHTTTGFELKGGHKIVIQCSDCHKGNLTAAKPECISCHQVQYENAPKHKQLGYPTDCAKCHTPNNWLETSFNHLLTNFPLTGAHIQVVCSTCHTNSFAGTPTECNSCHQRNYTAAVVPNHVAAGITNDCATCHTTTAWKPSPFNHITTGFELKGGHKVVVQCSDCHKSNLTAAKPECISCHQVQYENAPKHKQLGYPTDCAKCHTVNNWLETSFNHSLTNFPLKGAHTTVLCSSCHTNGFAGTPTACFSCHTTIYNNTTNPNHKAAGFPTNCEMCHSTNNWTSSTYNHSAYFPITSGRHKLSCATCHTNASNFTIFSCITSSCHTKDHNQSQGSAGCYRCHPTGKGD